MSHVMKETRVAIVFFMASSAFGADLTDYWGSRPPSPAVVNPVAVSPLQEIVTLRGEWDFVTDPRLYSRSRIGRGAEFRESDWSAVRKIEVPGCWEAQGVGEPGMSREWSIPFDCIPRPLHHVYMGTAIYRRTITIPEDWDGKRIWLKIGGVRTEAWLWVNRQRVAHLNTYCGSYKYDITDLIRPDRSAEIIAAVCNDTPSRKGCMAAFHRFGGFYRDIELEATPTTRIDDVWVRSDIEKGAAMVNVSVRGEGNTPLDSPSLEIAVHTLDGKLAGALRRDLVLGPDGGADIVCEVTLSEVHLWTPETPNLYLADVLLVSGDTPIHGWTERFGMRKLEVRGKRFYLNGQPFLVRGFGDDYIYPLTLISPPDREAHLAHLQTARAAGFNYVRHHTHCEIPEFFEAADEAGILVQPELPYYRDITTEGFEFDPLRDIQELYRHYRRYVSFASYSTGNEGHLGSPLDVEVYQWAKRTDPDRIFQHQDGGYNTPENSDYYTPNGYGLETSILPWTRGAYDALERPFIAHEYLNLGIKLDPRTAPRFTGAIPAPRSLESYEASLRAAGLDRAWGDACLNAAHALQGYYQKRGLEQARLDPACDGYSYWTIVDVMVQQSDTYTGQGFLNAFWEAKPGGLTPEQFRVFNGPTAILAELDSNDAIASSGDRRNIPLWVSHFTPETLRQVTLTWTLQAGEATLASGSLTPFDMKPGDVKDVGRCEFIVPALEKPVHATLRATMDGKDISNSWDFWFFPLRATKNGAGIAVTEDIFDAISKRYAGIVKAGTPEAESAQLIIGSWDHPDLLDAIKRGARGMMVGPANGKPNVKLGWWSLGDQQGTAFAEHPVFGDFPHDGTMTPLWFRLIKRGIPLPIDPAYGEFSLFAVGEGKSQYFAYILQKNGKEGSPLLMTKGVDLLADNPEAMYLMDMMVAYARSDAFTAQPAAAIAPRK